MNATESRFFYTLAVLAIVLPFCACSGMQNSSTTSPPKTQQVSIKLSQSSISLGLGAQEQFTAVVNGTTNVGVNWSVDSISGGNTSVGTITSGGLYTAPYQDGTHTVTATSVADQTKKASAVVTVTGALTVSPAAASVQAGHTQQFSAVINGQATTAVTWSVDGVSGGNSTVGSISSSGLYTAPAQVGTHTITATSTANSSTTAKAAISIWTMSISPGSAVLTAGATQQFQATVSGLSGTAVTWSVDGISGGNSTVGIITSAGLYTAPGLAGAHTVTATSTASASATVSAGISVWTISISPGSAVLAPSTTQQFQDTITGLSNTGAIWAVDGVTGGNSSTGTITSSGLYTAPSTAGSHNVQVSSAAYPSVMVTSVVTVYSGNLSQTAVLTYHNDDARDGAYTQEVTLTPSNVNSGTFGKVASYPVDGQIYPQPLYMPQVNINGTMHDVVFVATENNTVYAFDADASASNPTTFWQRHITGPKVVYDSGGPWPAVGIFSTPVIDATSNTMYFVVERGDSNPLFQLYAIDITTGNDKISPVAVTGSYSGDTLSPGCYQRMGLALSPVTNQIYIAFGSCDHGWILAYDKSTLAQTAVFDDTNQAAGGGFWAGGGAPAIDDNTGNVYLESGTDFGDDAWIQPPPTYTQIGYNDSFLNLNGSTLDVQSYFSPDNNYALAGSDADLGSGSPTLIPGNTQHPLEVVGGGKDGNVYVLDPLNMGGFNSTNNVIESVHTGTTQYDNIFSTPAYWNGNIYYHPSRDVVHAFSWNSGASDGQQMSSNPTSSGQAVFSDAGHGATVSVSANGNYNGIVWDIDNSAYIGNNPSGSGPAVLHAYNATNVSQELYNSTQAGSRDQAGQACKFSVPTIANGRVFVPTGTELDIYGLLGQ